MLSVDVPILEKTNTVLIEIPYGFEEEIEFNITDKTLTESTAVLYIEQPTGLPVPVPCSVSGNKVSYAPNPHDFFPGNNICQIRVGESLSMNIVVRCYRGAYIPTIDVLDNDFTQKLLDQIEVVNSKFDNAVSAVTTDTEVKDIRVGFDGTQYDTAGEAVRGQNNLIYDNVKNLASLVAYEETNNQYIEVGELLDNTQAQKAENGTLYLASGDGYHTKKLTITNEKRLRVTCFANQNERYGFGYCCVGEDYAIIDQYNNTDGKYTVEFDIPEGTLEVYANDNYSMNPINLKIENVIVETELKRIYFTKEESDNRYEKIPFFDLSLFPEHGVIGDSYASGELYYSEKYVDKYNISWGQILARKHGVNFTNFSKGGLTTRTWLTDGDKGLEYLKTSGEKDIYYLALGINDYYHLGESYLGSISDITEHFSYSEYGDTFYGNYGKIIEQIQIYAPKSKIIMFTMASTEELPEKFNKAIVEISNYYKIPCIIQSEDEFFRSEVYLNMSGGHPTAIGYSGMSVALERLINKCVKDNINYFYDCFMHD